MSLSWLTRTKLRWPLGKRTFACASPDLLEKRARYQDEHDAEFILVAYSASDLYYCNARDVSSCSSLCLTMLLILFRGNEKAEK